MNFAADPPEPTDKSTKTATRHISLRPLIAGVCLLVVSQVLIFPPGSDVSPYAAATGNQTLPITYGGSTIQVWAILLLLAICGVNIARAGRALSSRGFGWAMTATAVIVATGLLTSDELTDVAEGVGKLVLPLLIFIHVSHSMASGRQRDLSRLIVVINVFTIGQAGLCKVLTGSFSSNTYYLELSQEYFGYFYHPFAFSGILGACTIVALNEYSRGRHRAWMALLIAANLVFIAQTQVRTYILALAFALLVAAIGLTIGRRHPIGTMISAGAFTAVALVLGRSYLANERVTPDLSSGRLGRWEADIDYVLHYGSPKDALFGGGPGTIFDINESLFGVHINSLNAAVDIFVDFGIVGLFFVTAAWITLLRGHYGHTANPLVLSIVSLLFVSSMVTNPFEFPAVGAVLAVAIWALDRDDVTDSKWDQPTGYFQPTRSVHG